MAMLERHPKLVDAREAILAARGCEARPIDHGRPDRAKPLVNRAYTSTLEVRDACDPSSEKGDG